MMFFLLGLALFYISYAYFYQLGDKPLPFAAWLILSIAFLVAVLFFYKLNISISNDKLIAKLGIGLLKQSIDLNEIDVETIQQYKVPMLWGVGWRITPMGTLFNVSLGYAILIKSKNGSKQFFAGTRDYKNLKEAILKEINSIQQQTT